MYIDVIGSPLVDALSLGLVSLSPRLPSVPMRPALVLGLFGENVFASVLRESKSRKHSHLESLAHMACSRVFRLDFCRSEERSTPLDTHHPGG